MADPKQLCGIQITGGLLSLLNDVESYYKQSVICQLIPSSKLSRGAHSGITTSNGVPVIRFDPNVKPSADVIAHELLHLKMNSQGFADLIFRPPLPNDQVTGMVKGLFLEPVLHWVFRHEMEQLGLSLDHYSQFWINDVSKASIKELQGLTYLPWYFRFKLELDGSPAHVQFSQALIEKGFKKDVIDGDALAAYVVSKNPRSPSEVAEVQVGLLNKLVVGEFSFKWDCPCRFELGDWTETPIGPILRQKAVIVNVHPL